MSVDESASGESVTASQVMELSAVAEAIEAVLEGRYVVRSERFGELCGEHKRLQDMAELFLQSAVTERTNAETRYNRVFRWNETGTLRRKARPTDLFPPGP